MSVLLQYPCAPHCLRYVAGWKPALHANCHQGMLRWKGAAALSWRTAHLALRTSHCAPRTAHLALRTSHCAPRTLPAGSRRSTSAPEASEHHIPMRDGAQRQRLVLFLKSADMPFALEENDRESVDILDELGAAVEDDLLDILGRPADPARGDEGERGEDHLDVVLALQTELHNIELQTTDRGKDRVGRAHALL